MRRAIELAEQGLGLTRPNPPVGAVIVKQGRVVGEGFHRKAGGPHAEVNALKHAGEKAANATAYLTLEPCSTTGRTPPCTEALLKAGIKEVVVACKDPNPKHAGKGLELLKKQGVKVTEGILEEDAARLIQPFKKWVLEGKPFLTLKLGMTLDGRVADRKKASRWITGAVAREDVQALRRKVDAVLVGTGTVYADNPKLFPRPAKGRKPYRVVLDRKGRLPLTRNVFSDDWRSQTLVYTTRQCPAQKFKRFEAACGGVKVVRGASTIQLGEVLADLGKKGVMHVLCEGGGALAGSLVQENLVDELIIYYGGSLLGDLGTTGGLAGVSWLMSEKPLFEILHAEKMGADLKVTAIPER